MKSRKIKQGWRKQINNVVRQNSMIWGVVIRWWALFREHTLNWQESCT